MDYDIVLIKNSMMTRTVRFPKKKIIEEVETVELNQSLKLKYCGSHQTWRSTELSDIINKTSRLCIKTVQFLLLSKIASPSLKSNF